MPCALGQRQQQKGNEKKTHAIEKDRAYRGERGRMRKREGKLKCRPNTTRK